MTRSPLVLEHADVSVRTYAEGFAARLAHDLLLEAPCAEGTVEGGRACLVFRVDALRVVGVLCREQAGRVLGERVDPRVLSAGDRTAIEARAREAFRDAREIRVTAIAAGAAGAAESGAAGAADVEIVLEVLGAHAPRERCDPKDGTPTRTTRVPCRAVIAWEPERLRVSGACSVRLPELGVGKIRGPLNAFHVAERVDVTFEATFRRRL